MNFSSDSMPSKIIDIFSSPGQSAIRITKNYIQTKWITTFYLVRTRKGKVESKQNKKN